jgi:hypothetical protein
MASADSASKATSAAAPNASTTAASKATSQARAYGYSERAVAILASLLRRRRADAQLLRIGPRTIEIEMVPGATVRLERPIGCPHYEPAADSARCRSYLPDGACARPDELVCVELVRLRNLQRSSRSST